MPRLSAGLLMDRIKDDAIQVLLAHPGGPFLYNKDEGSWTIPKGEPEGNEDLLITAQREFEEETGVKPTGPFTPFVRVATLPHPKILPPLQLLAPLNLTPPESGLTSVRSSAFQSAIACGVANPSSGDHAAREPDIHFVSVHSVAPC